MYVFVNFELLHVEMLYGQTLVHIIMHNNMCLNCRYISKPWRFKLIFLCVFSFPRMSLEQNDHIDTGSVVRNGTEYFVTLLPQVGIIVSYVCLLCHYYVL